ncbi:hypothetical protein [Paenibacillus tyrfis]|uniref:hypothetical protein n=1 Tax=Paenibacillus tyrfis TaxID=1501230 RepID=UPI000B58D766|nr:hypothetical protein [Paenibacillus tyrfis]
MLKRYWIKVIPFIALMTIGMIVIFILSIWIKALGFTDTYVVAWIGFIGSILGGIIGGILTFIGVKLTLEHQDRTKFLENFNIKMTIIDETIDEIKDIIGLGVFIAKYGESMGLDREQYILVELLKFQEKLNNRIPSLRHTIDYSVIHKIEIMFSGLNELARLDSNIDRNKISAYFDPNKVNRMLDSAQTICGELLKYKETLRRKYYYKE